MRKRYLIDRCGIWDDADDMTATPGERTQFGSRLRELRGDRSLAELSKWLLVEHGIDASPAVLSGWERGEYAPRRRATVKEIDAALGAGGELVTLLYGTPVTPTTEELVVVVRELAEVVRELRAEMNAARQQDT